MSVTSSPWTEVRAAAAEAAGESLCCCVSVAGPGIATAAAVTRAVLSGSVAVAPRSLAGVHRPTSLAGIMACRGLGDIVDSSARGRQLATAAVIVAKPQYSFDDEDASVNNALPALVATETAVLVWCAGPASGAQDIIETQLAGLAKAHCAVGSLVACQQHVAAGGPPPPRPEALRGSPLHVVVAVDDDLGADTTALQTAFESISRRALGDLKRATVDVRVVPLGAGASDMRIGAVADAALERLCEALTTTPEPPENEGSEVDVSDPVDADGFGAHADGGDVRLAGSSGLQLRQRLDALPAPERLFPLPASAASSRAAPSAWRIELGEELVRGFMAEDAVRATRASLQRLADSSIAGATSTSKIAESAPAARAKWAAEVDAAAQAACKDVQDKFFGGGADASALRVYSAQADAILKAHRETVFDAVLYDHRRGLAARLSDRVVEVMDAMMSVRDARASAEQQQQQPE